VFITHFLLESADPAATRVHFAVPAEYEVHLVDQFVHYFEIIFFSCLPVEFKKIADCKGVCPQVTLGRP
jgi:hypothetical protein